MFEFTFFPMVESGSGSGLAYVDASSELHLHPQGLTHCVWRPLKMFTLDAEMDATTTRGGISRSEVYMAMGNRIFCALAFCSERCGL